jgi:hypothetical protein
MYIPSIFTSQTCQRAPQSSQPNKLLSSSESTLSVSFLLSTSTASMSKKASQIAKGYEPSNAEEKVGTPQLRSKQEQEEETQEDGEEDIGVMLPQPHSHPRLGTISGGLYGDTSIPVTLPAMPKLGGPTATQYTDWRIKALGYFQTNGLTEVVTTDPTESLTLAVKIDGGFRTELQIKALWHRLHSKAIGAIRMATEPILGTSVFDDIESEQDRFGKCDIYSGSTKSKLPWIGEFISGNAHYLWNKIRAKLEQFTPHDLSRLVDRYMNLKYSPRQDPVVFRREFDSSIRELKQAGLTLPDKLHMSIWYRALPPEYESLRQALGARPNLSWLDIYEAIMTQYSAGNSKRTKRGDQETAFTAVDDKTKDRNRKPKPDSKKATDPRDTNKDQKKRWCGYCQKATHNEDKCYTLQRERKQAYLLSKKGGGKPSNANSDESDEECAAPFIENELLSGLSSGSIDETAAAIADSQNMDLGSVHFIFDSAATTHVTPVKRIVQEMKDSPEMSMSTALIGHRSIINKRGKVRLNDKWTLRDVAYLPNASASLISEGRLADAGYNIIKNKEYVIVTDSKGKVVLRGPRVNRLWIFTINGKGPGPKPINTIIPSQPLRNTTPSSPINGQKGSDSMPQRRVRFLKDATTTATQKQATRASAQPTSGAKSS